MIETKFKDTEIGKIPQDWEVIPLGSVGEPLMCKRIMKWQTNNSGGIPFYKIGTFGRKADAFIDKNTFEYYRTHFNYPNRGDILISAAGTIGRIVAYDGTPAYFQDSNIVWISNNQTKALNAFLYYYYKIVKWNTEDGGIVTRLYNENLKSTLIAVPSLSEQRRIADALSKVDSLIESLDKLIAKKKAIKRGAMQELLTGKKRLPGFEGEWTYKRLGDISDIYQPETISQERFIERGYPVYGANGIIGFYSKYNHHTDQILITCRGNSCGTVNYSRGKCWITGNAMVVNLDNRIDCYKLFYYYYLTYLDLTTLVSGSGQPQITRKPVEYQKVVIPSLSEQRAIAHVLSTMDAEIDALKQKRDKIKQVKQGMMQDLLTGRIRLVDK